MKDLIIGSHVSFTKNDQLLGSVNEALSYGANTFMLYTGAPQNTNRALIDDEMTKKAHFVMKENNIDFNNVIVHAPYIINPANEINVDFAISFLKQEIDRIKKNTSLKQFDEDVKRTHQETGDKVIIDYEIPKK